MNNDQKIVINRDGTADNETYTLEKGHKRIQKIAFHATFLFGVINIEKLSKEWELNPLELFIHKNNKRTSCNTQPSK